MPPESVSYTHLDVYKRQGAKRIRIGNGERNVLPVPSGDLEAAYLATGIADITVYMTTPLNPMLARLVLPRAQKLLSWDALRQQLARWLDGRPASSVAKLVDANRRSWLWVQATDRHGNKAEAWPVSYTHLDVYKRQLHMIPARL